MIFAASDRPVATGVHVDIASRCWLKLRALVVDIFVCALDVMIKKKSQTATAATRLLNVALLTQ